MFIPTGALALPCLAAICEVGYDCQSECEMCDERIKVCSVLALE